MNELELKAALEQLEKNLKVAASEDAKKQIQSQIDELKKSIPDTKGLEAGINEVKTSLETVHAYIKQDEADKKANQEALDKLIVDAKNRSKQPNKELKTFSQAFAEQLPDHMDGIAKVKKGQPYRMEVKTVGDMSLSNLTGDSVATYSGRQAIVPAQKINFRDLIPTVVSDTGLYVQYRETGSEGSIAVQTEGSAKAQIDYDFTEVKVVNDYIAGIARFSKQMMRSLPWLQGTLPRLLMRDFFKNENSIFWTAVTGAATGSTTTGETADIKQIMDYLAALADTDYTPSFVVMNNESVARINKSLLDTGNYQGAGGVLSLSNGSLSVNGVPVVPASWAASDKVLIFDRDYLERVQVEAITVEFFEQDADNVSKNKITARIECYEDINLMLPASATYADLGNVS